MEHKAPKDHYRVMFIVDVAQDDMSPREVAFRTEDILQDEERAPGVFHIYDENGVETVVNLSEEEPGTMEPAREEILVRALRFLLQEKRTETRLEMRKRQKEGQKGDSISELASILDECEEHMNRL